MEIAGGTADISVDAEDTTEGVHIIEVVGYGEPDPHFADCRCFAPQVRFTYNSCISFFLCICYNCMYFCWGRVNGK